MNDEYNQKRHEVLHFHPIILFKALICYDIHIYCLNVFHAVNDLSQEFCHKYEFLATITDLSEVFW